MKKSLDVNSKGSHGYTIVELTVAASILAAGLLSVAALTNLSQEVDNVHQPKRRVVAIMEARAKLWQLGLNINDVNSFAFSDPALPLGAANYTNAILNGQTVAMPADGGGGNLTFNRLTQQVTIDGVNMPTITGIQSPVQAAVQASN